MKADEFEKFFGGHADQLRALRRHVQGAQRVWVRNENDQLRIWTWRHHRQFEQVLNVSIAELTQAVSETKGKQWKRNGPPIQFLSVTTQPGF